MRKDLANESWFSGGLNGLSGGDKRGIIHLRAVKGGKENVWSKVFHETKALFMIIALNQTYRQCTGMLEDDKCIAWILADFI